MTSISRLDLGAYEAPRAAALAGVPPRTVYDWALKGLVVPSVNAEREKLWSYGDLLTLRLVRWLRTDKPDVARTKMGQVRALIAQHGDRLWQEDAAGRDVPTIGVDSSGGIVLVECEPARTLDGQGVFEGVDFFRPRPGEPGVDLRRPRPRLRIVPGKVAGEPHLVGSRLTTRSIAGLADRGFSLDLIAELYPTEDPEALADALDLEAELRAA